MQYTGIVKINYTGIKRLTTLNVC